MTSASEQIEHRVRESIAVKQGLLDEGVVSSVDRAVGVLVNAYRAGNKALFFGNGGSAADAQHIAAELAGRFYLDRPGLPASALNTNSSIVTAIANDFGFTEVFARQIAAEGRPGDVAVGLSTSGSSENVVAGLKTARSAGLSTIVLCGMGGPVAEAAEVAVMVPSTDTPRVQECHILIGHILCELVEASLFGSSVEQP